jgi:hypothetical protein
VRPRGIDRPSATAPHLLRDGLADPQVGIWLARAMRWKRSIEMAVRDNHIRNALRKTADGLTVSTCTPIRHSKGA